MKVKEIKKETFKPVTLELTIDSIEELRLLFYCFDHKKLLQLLKTDDKFAPSINEQAANHLDGDGYKILKDIIESRGFNR